MGKFYAKQCDPELFNYEAYYNEEDAVNDKLWCGGNRDFKEINSELISNAKQALDNYDYEIDKYDDVYEFIIDYLGEDWRDADKRIKGDKFEEICKNVEASLNKKICSILELVYDEPFICGTIKGNDQSDWLYYICPESLRDRIRYIEAVLFATGTEFEVTEDQFDEKPDFRQVNTLTWYTYKADVKSELAEVMECDVEDLVVLTICGAHTVVYYEYEEI